MTADWYGKESLSGMLAQKSPSDGEREASLIPELVTGGYAEAHLVTISLQVSAMW